MNQTYQYPYPFTLESGNALPELSIDYTFHGEYKAGVSKVIWVCHALTANSEVFDWWPGLFGEDSFFNSSNYFIVCANILGSCYGTTGPLSINVNTGRPYFHDFPEITIRDMVRVHKILADYLSIQEIHLLLGGSLGGQQAMEWAILEPERIKKLSLLVTNARHSPWGIAFNESQRMAIENDPSWKLNTEKAGLEGMKTARSIALLTYRNYRTYQEKQLDPDDHFIKEFKASTYQRYQGLKLARRFNAFSYWHLSKSMDSHNIGRNRGGVLEALKKITCPCLVIGISSDILFPIEEQEFLYKNLPNAQLAVLDSLYGHDGFLIETPILSRVLKDYLLDN